MKQWPVNARFVMRLVITPTGSKSSAPTPKTTLHSSQKKSLSNKKAAISSQTTPTLPPAPWGLARHGHQTCGSMAGMSENPFKIGDRVQFVPNERAQGWSWFGPGTLKRLAVVVLIAIVLPIYGQKEGTQSGGNQTNPNTTERPPLPPRTATCKVKEDGTTIECNWAETKPESYFKRLISPENAPNIALFVVGFFGIIAAICTLRAINRQATLMKRSLATCCWSSKERARLELNVQPTNLDVEVAGDDLVHLIATVSVRNVGASKAFIGRTSGTLITRLRNETLGDNDDYSPLDLPEQVIAPDQSPIPIRVYCFPTTTTTQTFADYLEEDAFTLHFFGFIEYETLGFWRRKEFGYDWNVVDRHSGLSGMLGLSDPYPNSHMPARNRITYGHWHVNEEKDKPEYPISSG